jgi:hypothetical protein
MLAEDPYASLHLDLHLPATAADHANRARHTPTAFTKEIEGAVEALFPADEITIGVLTMQTNSSARIIIVKVTEEERHSAEHWPGQELPGPIAEGFNPERNGPHRRHHDENEQPQILKMHSRLSLSL